MDIPKICPECGAQVKHKTGVGKKGNYDFYGCGAFPECKWTYKPDSRPSRNSVPQATPTPKVDIDQGERIVNGLLAIYNLLNERLPKKIDLLKEIPPDPNDN